MEKWEKTNSLASVLRRSLDVGYLVGAKAATELTYLADNSS